jgi:hypothetical protein
LPRKRNCAAVCQQSVAIKNAMESVGARYGCDDCSNGGICGGDFWEKQSAGAGIDECEQGSF